MDEAKSSLQFSLDNRAVSYAGIDVLDSDLIGIELNTRKISDEVARLFSSQRGK